MPAPTILWMVPLSKPPNGQSIRIINFGREFRAAGISVHVLQPDHSECVSRPYFDAGAIDGFSVVPVYKPAGPRGALSRFLFHPAIKDFVRRPQQQPFIDALLAEVRRHNASAVIIGHHDFLSAVPELSKHVVVAIDWGDSYALHNWRDFKYVVARRQYHQAPKMLFRAAAAAMREGYYPRHAQVNTVVSPADQQVIRRLSGNEISLVLLGVGPVAPPARPKVPDRLIFSGVMNFEPNYRSALWFIDNVLPLVRAKRSAVHFVIAGRDPAPQLLARCNDHVSVTGQVPDLTAEIAQAALYVAPMVVGCGFKNKVVEALASGTPVVGTTIAGEFLPPELKADVVTADEPSQMAVEILNSLEQPDLAQSRVAHAQEILRNKYCWSERARELAAILQSAPSPANGSAPLAFKRPCSADQSL